MDFPSFIDLITRRRWVMIAFVVLGVGAGVGLSALVDRSYRSSAQLLFREDPLVQALITDQNPTDAGADEREGATNVALASLDSVAERVKRKTSSPEGVTELRERVVVEANGESDIVTVTAEATSARGAADLANAFAAEVVLSRRRSARVEIGQAIDAVRGQLRRRGLPPGERRRLDRRLRQLRTLRDLESGGVEVAQRARPPADASSPQPARSAALGGAAGLLLAIALVLLHNRLDRRVREEDELVHLMGAPVLARLPNRAGSEMVFDEALQFLRANLQFQSRERSVETIAVVSAVPQDGKSTVVAGLASSLAESGLRALAVDCDLRRPMLASAFQVDAARGVSTALMKGEEAREMIQPTHKEGLALVAAGPAVSSAPAVLSDPARVQALFAELRVDHEFVVVDTPPLTLAAEASVVATAVDGVVLVIDMASADRRRLRTAREQLRNADARLLGLVLNRAELKQLGYYYDRYYSRESGFRTDEAKPGWRLRRGGRSAGG